MSFPRYERYKDSSVEWLGEVPEHWKPISLGWALSANDGGAWGEDPDGENDVIVLRSTEQTSTGEWKIEDPCVRKLTDKDIAATLLADGDLLVTKSSGSALHIGKTTIVDRAIAASNCGFSNFMQRLRLKPSVLLPRLAWYILNSELSRYQFDLLSNSTSGLANINAGIIERLLVVIPPAKEQALIASFLHKEITKIDALIEEQRRLIELLKEKRQAIISHAVTKGLNHNAPMKDSGAEWLGSIPTHWAVVTAKHVSTIFVPQRNKPELNQDGDGLPWVTMDQMKAAEVASSGEWVSQEAAGVAGTRTLTKGAVIASCVGNFGTASVNSCDVVINQQLQAFLPDGRIRTGFLRYRVESAKSYFEQIGTAATIPYVNQQGFAALPIALPPVSEQDRILLYLNRVTSDIDQLLLEIRDSTLIFMERRTALISAAVTGKIDVRSYTPKEAA